MSCQDTRERSFLENEPKSTERESGNRRRKSEKFFASCSATNQRRQPANEKLMHQNQQPIANEISELCRTLENVLLAKNKAYGNSAGQVPLFVKDATQETAIMVRANDKIRRLDNLLKNGGDENDESISDTIQDLAGYCILWLVERKRNRTGENQTEGAENETV